MFDYLRERVSLLLSRSWPMAEGRISAVYVDTYSRGSLFIAYEFSVGEDKAQYTGTCPQPWWFGGAGVINTDAMVGQTVTVRYRKDDPSVSTLDHEFWSGLEGI